MGYASDSDTKTAFGAVKLLAATLSFILSFVAQVCFGWTVYFFAMAYCANQGYPEVEPEDLLRAAFWLGLWFLLVIVMPILAAATASHFIRSRVGRGSTVNTIITGAKVGWWIASIILAIYVAYLLLGGCGHLVPVPEYPE